MPFDPTYPPHGAELESAPLRSQFNALHEEAIAPETDPVFAASEAAQFMAGDKAKLDAALQPDTGLKLDQSAPQTLTGGAPLFAVGLNIGSNEPVSAKFTSPGDGQLHVAADVLAFVGNGVTLNVSEDGVCVGADQVATEEWVNGRGFYEGDGAEFATAAQGASADTAYGWAIMRRPVMRRTPMRPPMPVTGRIRSRRRWRKHWTGWPPRSARTAPSPV